MAELSDNIVKKEKKIAKEEERIISGVQSNSDYEDLLKSLKGIKKEEFDKLKEAALTGDLQVLLRLAICYYHGIQTPIDYQQAISFFEMTAKKRCPVSLNALGVHYMERGEYTKAFGFLKDGADEGTPAAWCNLGALLIQGLGVPQGKELCSQREGFRYIKLAAETGCGEALNSLGTCYVHQIGIPEDDKPVYLLRAIDCYLEAIQQGSKNAKESLLNMLTEENRYQKEEMEDHLN